MESRRRKGSGWCTQLENRTFWFCCKLFSNVNAALSIDGFCDWSSGSVRLAERALSYVRLAECALS